MFDDVVDNGVVGFSIRDCFSNLQNFSCVSASLFHRCQ